MTAEKRAREQRLREPRAAKNERKAARKVQADAARAAATPPDPEETGRERHTDPSD